MPRGSEIYRGLILLITDATNLQNTLSHDQLAMVVAADSERDIRVDATAPWKNILSNSPAALFTSRLSRAPVTSQEIHKVVLCSVNIVTANITSQTDCSKVFHDQEGARIRQGGCFAETVLLSRHMIPQCAEPPTGYLGRRSVFAGAKQDSHPDRLTAAIDMPAGINGILQGFANEWQRWTVIVGKELTRDDIGDIVTWCLDSWVPMQCGHVVNPLDSVLSVKPRSAPYLRRARALPLRRLHSHFGPA